MWYDADIDPHMRRTMNRPFRSVMLPAICPVFGSIIAIIGSSLFLLVSVGGVLVGIFSVLFYVLVYSMWLKRRTPQNIVIGGLLAPLLHSSAGRRPPVIPSPTPTCLTLVHPCPDAVLPHLPLDAASFLGVGLVQVGNTAR